MAVMAEDRAGFGKAAFASAFSALQPVLLAEWGELDAESLAATEGDLERVVALIAERSSRTKVLVRRQIEEIFNIVTEPVSSGAARARARGGERTAERTGQPGVDQLLAELEKRTAQIMRELRGGFVDSTRDRVRDNIFFSLLVAIGFGFIVGVLFTGSNRGK
jgi:ElaB/YqjD/DUF883 family membrane-anchored ribosome-binding protein